MSQESKPIQFRYVMIVSILVSCCLAIVLTGLLSLLQPELIFAGFPMGAALGGSLAGYMGRRFPIAQGVVAGIAVSGMELLIFFWQGFTFLPVWSLVILVVVNMLTGLLGARLGYSVRPQPPIDPDPPAVDTGIGDTPVPSDSR